MSEITLPTAVPVTLLLLSLPDVSPSFCISDDHSFARPESDALAIMKFE